LGFVATTALGLLCRLLLSVAGDFDGLKAGEWILVSGFTNTVLNDWYQLIEDSNVNQIPVTTTLAVEAAGDSVSIIGYVRGAKATFSFNLECQQEDVSRKIIKSVATALDGNTETITQRRENRFNLAVTLIGDAALNQMIEFLNSVESGEIFTFDQVGTTKKVINPLSAKIDGNGYSISRVGNAYKTISFRLILL